MKTSNHKALLVGLQAGLMSLGTFFSRILGFLRDLLIAAFFSKTETDIFFVAFRFPNFFRRFLGEGLFSATVTPALTESLQKDKKNSQELYVSLFTLLFCVVALLTVLGFLFMPEIMNLFFGQSAYGRIEGKLQKTILVGRIVFVYLFFVSFYSYFMSVAQVFGKFFIPALAPAFFNLSLICFACTPKSWWPFASLSLAWAVVLGGLLQLIPVLYVVKKLDFWPRFVFRFKTPEVLKTLKRFLPGMLGLAGLSLIGLINVYFAGWLEEGAPSYIYYGDRLMEFPRSLIAVSIGTALVPELTRQFSSASMQEFKATISRYIRLLLFLTLPCAVVFLCSSQAIVELLFGRGEFDSLSVLKTSMILKIYSVVLVFSSLTRVLSSCFFSLNKNWYIVIGSVLFVTVHTVLAGILTSLYGLKGLVGATALSCVIHFVFLLLLLLLLIGRLDFKKIAHMLVKIIPGLSLLFLSLKLYPYVLKTLSGFLSPALALPLTLLPILCFAGGLYILSALWLREQTAEEFLKLFKKLFKKS